ncbi:MAG: glycerol-3-phosphate 1-O-acyltransferase PlsY [Bacteroidales bacterium]|nr:glycerol-3-phosphate 1-O-acyltransferase PlsY [Bacteroidales bacterium]
MEWISILTGYILGSVPSAVWLGQTFHNTDVREYGSKNAGATNTFRVLGWKTGVIVLLSDMIKGYGAILICERIFSLPPQDTVLVLTGATAVLGHIFPLFAGFRGGKGIATLAGIGIALFPLSFIIILGIFLLVFLSTRYVSLGSIIGAISLPFVSFFIEQNQNPQIVVFTIIIAIIVPMTHRKNIIRLKKGTEKKLKITNNKN